MSAGGVYPPLQHVDCYCVTYAHVPNLSCPGILNCLQTSHARTERLVVECAGRRWLALE